jgi:hypothetical protein
MHTLLISIFTSFFLLLSTPVMANQCDFTVRQHKLLNMAASYGLPFGYQKTLAGIVMQESFVGVHIVKNNPSDGKYGSYGITHILLETAMWLEKETSYLRARDVIFSKLVEDDMYALSLAVKKLDSVHKGNWMNTWAAYNGGSKNYAISIRNNIRLLESCGYFSWG